ncbi:MAG: hypothetical protein J6A53_05525, partial [Clostridia bacterium]|nr:hypothetical protein [Clostridia bacterium]
MKEGGFEIFLPGEEGYEDSNVIIENYEPAEKNDVMPKFQKSTLAIANDDEDEIEEEEFEEEELDSAELMGAQEVFNDDSGFSIEDGEE